LTRFSVIVPTFQRRDTVARTVSALEQQSERDFEAIVVIDGSDDGSATALRGLDLSFSLRVIEQQNQGAAAARNAGVDASGGELVVFLDDDMRADPALLAEHDRSHRAGADMVMGDMPLDPASPRNLLSWGVGSWAASRSERLSAPGAEIRLDDLLTGQMSISRAAYLAVGGLDPTFTRDGLFGGEDLDFGHRVLAAGYEVVFNPAAISYQYYDVDPARYLRRARETGRSDRELIAKHPELAGAMGASPSFKTRRSRWLLTPFVLAPAFLAWPLRAGAAALARSGLNTPRVRSLFFAVRTMEYLRGARLAERGGAQ
jgi:glycosyltransferase involved in cell wall biosynthesis